MKKVVKLLIIDPDDRFLLMYRSDHPQFGEDPDLPGGTMEDSESLLETLLREVKEEAGITIDEKNVEEIYSGTDYSTQGTHYALFVTRLNVRPKVVISWEHSSYKWLERDAFLREAKSANDTYMHMVSDAASKHKSL